MYVALNCGICYYNILGVNYKGFMLRTKVLCYNNILRVKTKNKMGLGFEGRVKKMTRALEVFNILQKNDRNPC